MFRELSCTSCAYGDVVHPLGELCAFCLFPSNSSSCFVNYHVLIGPMGLSSSSLMNYVISVYFLVRVRLLSDLSCANRAYGDGVYPLW